MKPFFLELYEYNHHCNQELSKVFLKQEEKIPSRPVELFTHLIFAHHTWMCRINNSKTRFGIWGKLSAGELQLIDIENYKHFLNILKVFEFDDLVSYQNSKRQHYTNSLRDILFHVINHSTYHRGQIAKDLRAAGLEPLVSDYIFHKRLTL